MVIRKSKNEKDQTKLEKTKQNIQKCKVLRSDGNYILQSYRD